MPKTLRIEYAGIVIHDGPVDEFQMSENADSIAVVGKTKPVKAAGGGLLDALTAARKAQTAGIADQKRRQLNTTTSVEIADQPEPESASD